MLHDRRTRRRGDAATRWIRGAVAFVYLALAITNLLTLTGSARLVMTVLDSVTAVLMTIAALRPRRYRNRRERARGEALAFVPVAVSVAQVAMSGLLHYSSTLMMTFLAIGAAVTSRSIAATATLLGCGGWAITVAAQGHLHGPELGYYAVQMALSALLGGLLHEALRRRQQQLRAAHHQVTTVADRFEQLFNASPSGVAIADGSATIVAANPAFCTLIGQPVTAVVGGTVEGYVTGAPEEKQRFEHADGSVRWAYLTIGSSQVAGQPWTLVQLQDVTERHLAEEAVRDSDRLLAAVAAAARRIRTGEEARDTIIAAVRDLAAADSVSLLEPADCPTAREVVVTRSAGADVIGVRVPLDGSSMIARVFRSGEPIFLPDADQDPRVSAALLKMVGGRSMLWQPVVVDGVVTAMLAVGWGRRVDSMSDYRTRAVALLADETALALEHEKLLHRLERMAFTDTLTALPNRRAWQESMARLVEQAHRTGEPLSMAIADLDHFKRFNDTRGHAAGDELLRRAAGAFSGVLREQDFIARWGGEEFVVALPASTTSQAVAVLERLRAAVPDAQTCSIGLATWNGAESVEQLLQRADDALYTAKHEGRDRIHTADAVLIR